VLDGLLATVVGIEFAVQRTYGRLQFVGGESARSVLGRALAEGGVLVTESFAHRHRVRTGQWLALPTPAGSVAVKVEGVFYDYSSDAGAVLMDRALYARAWRAHESLALYLRPAWQRSVRAAFPVRGRTAPARDGLRRCSVYCWCSMRRSGSPRAGPSLRPSRCWAWSARKPAVRRPPQLAVLRRALRGRARGTGGERGAGCRGLPLLRYPWASSWRCCGARSTVLLRLASACPWIPGCSCAPVALAMTRAGGAGARPARRRSRHRRRAESRVNAPRRRRARAAAGGALLARRGRPRRRRQPATPPSSAVATDRDDSSRCRP
jgi:hypothetical protein